MADLTNGMATVTLSLLCEVTYTITAGGLLDDDLVGPRSCQRIVMGGPCPLVMTTASLGM